MIRPELGLPQVHAFVVLAEELHFGRAAQRLGIAQPPLSQQIRRLEAKVGYPLFERGARGVTLTPAGQELLPAARRALGELADGLRAARQAGHGQIGRIRVGFAASLALTLLPNLLRTYRDRYPAVDLEIREMTTAPQIAALLGESLDVGLLREPPAAEGLAIEPILAEDFIVLLPAAHRLAARRSVPLSALAPEPFILLPRAVAPTVHDRIMEVCRTAGFTPQIAQHAVEWQTVAALVEAGIGVALAPASTRRIRLRGVAHRRIDRNTVRSVVAMCWRASDRNPLVARFVECVRDQMRREPNRR